MLGMAAVFVLAAKQKAYTGISDGVLNLSMRSILSEYDLTLYERYGLLAFEKNAMEASMDIIDYVDFTFPEDTPVKKVQVGFGEYSMADTDNLRQQILEYMKSPSAVGMIDNETKNVERMEWKDRTLRNQGLINNLPSRPFADGGSGFIDRIQQLKDQIKSVEDVFKKTSDTYLIDTYIMNHFKHATCEDTSEPSFFQHEVEYILTGNYSNAVNKEKTETAIKLLRTAMNTVFLYSDEKRNAQTMAAAELLTPASAPATQAVIITTWATAEASNDMKLLLKGRPVPFKKTDASWATSLDNVLNNVVDGCIDTGNDKGLYYDEYLRVLLHFQNENVKLARVADLIQINMKGTQDRGFLLETCNSGMEVSAEIYGKRHNYETHY